MMKTRMRTWIVAAGFAALACMPAAASAQSAVARGHFLVDGDASLSSQGEGDGSDRATSISLSPSAQYFLRSGLGVGGFLSWAHTSRGAYHSNAYSVGPRASYYFPGGESHLHPYLTAGVGVGAYGAESPSSVGNFKQHVDLTHVEGGLGVLALLTESVGVHGALFYNRDSYGGDRDGHVDAYGLAFGFDIFLGR